MPNAWIAAAAEGMDSVDVACTCTCNIDSVFPPLVIVIFVHDPYTLPTSAVNLTHRCCLQGSVEAVYALEIEDSMAKMSWQARFCLPWAVATGWLL